jgi:hypothetical protein
MKIADGCEVWLTAEHAAVLTMYLNKSRTSNRHNGGGFTEHSDCSSRYRMIQFINPPSDLKVKCAAARNPID